MGRCWPVCWVGMFRGQSRKQNTLREPSIKQQSTDLFKNTSLIFNFLPWTNYQGLNILVGLSWFSTLRSTSQTSQISGENNTTQQNRKPSLKTTVLLYILLKYFGLGIWVWLKSNLKTSYITTSAYITEHICMLYLSIGLQNKSL